MTSRKLLDLMSDMNILVEKETNEYLISDEFNDINKNVLQKSRDFSNKKIDKKFNSIFSSFSGIDNTKYTKYDKIELLSCYKAVNNLLNNTDKDTKIKVTCTIEVLKNSRIRKEGDPECFLSVDDELLRKTLGFFPKCVIYVWKKECPPCDTVKSDLEDILTDSSRNIALFSINGPENSKFLYDYYDVVGAPTLLLISRGNVVCRHEGAKYKSAIKSDLDKLVNSKPVSEN